MERNFILFLLALAPFMMLAQKKDPTEKETFFRVGLKGGLNLNKIQGRSFKQEFNYNYQLGGFLQFNITPKLGIQPEVNFVQASAEPSSDITVIYDDLFLGGSQKKAKLNYLKVAGLLNVDIGPSQRVKLQLGPQWGRLLHEKVDSLKTPRNIFKDGEVLVLAGLLFQLPLIHMGTRYELGLSNINDIDNKDQWKSQAWQIFIGVTL